ncbi:hypothetical protein BM221_010330 [Beauveria bassiana]|uniref:Uncharacterized protein n=1 Tax=Beauveria bassiana TaxID=176275 RepID=A0A2N6N9E3_BEABA|nr:hypothetical protein BM221_010330 [Beauveria bassiana]
MHQRPTERLRADLAVVTKRLQLRDAAVRCICSFVYRGDAESFCPLHIADSSSILSWDEVEDDRHCRAAGRLYGSDSRLQSASMAPDDVRFSIKEGRHIVLRN